MKQNIKVASRIFLIALFTLASCAHTQKTIAPTTTPKEVAIAPVAEKSPLSELKAGNLRFVHHETLHPRQDQARLLEQSTGQKPGSIVISCSDSRVPPELVFDQGLGDIFSVRTAGQALDVYSVASVEYAIEHLNAKTIVVMGHSSCGAVKAAATTPPGQSTGSKNIDQLVHKLRPGLNPFDEKDKELIQASKNNVLATIDYLKFKSPLIREELEHHKIEIVPALYHLPTGEVEFW